MLILAIDQGTTNTKALVFDEMGEIRSSASAPCSTSYPEPGWAEQSSDEIWQTTAKVIAEACAGIEAQIAGIGISNQRETLVVWDAKTGQPIGPAPIWQCRRTAAACAALVEAGHSDRVNELTGLEINPLFPATKLAWVLRHRPEAEASHSAGTLRVGTVDSWLLWNLTGGAAFATDHSNASRTLLFDTASLEWSTELSDIFEAPLDCLPDARASDSLFGHTKAGTTTLPDGVPIFAMMGDSHAALFGHGVREAGPVKATFGTGSSLMTLTKERVMSKNGVSGTIGWTVNDTPFYALEGNITVSAQAADFMRSILGLSDVAALSDLAQSVPDSGGVIFVPALAGLGAPHWKDNARGSVSGLHHGTNSAHIARATFDAIAHQVADVFEAMEADLDHTLESISADGGGSRNGFLMQLQADLLDRPVLARDFAEIGAYGVASLTAEKLGRPFPSLLGSTVEYEPIMGTNDRNDARSAWRSAVSLL